LPENDSEVRDSTSRGKDMESKSFSEAPRRPFQPLSGSQQYNRESPKSPKFYHFGNDFRAGENRNHSNRISTSSGREDIFEEVL
jgi:hypothetical protein